MAETHGWDPLMELAGSTADMICPQSRLPASLSPDGRSLREANESRTRLLREVANHLDEEIRVVQNAVGDSYDFDRLVPLLADRLRENSTIADLVWSFMPDVPDAVERISICLRLWAGYLDAAKTLAPETRSGPNTPETRQQNTQVIERKAANNPVYAAGVECAPHFKRRVLREPIFREGIPDGSIMLNDWND